jgi:hypothetical protein
MGSVGRGGSCFVLNEARLAGVTAHNVIIVIYPHAITYIIVLIDIYNLQTRTESRGWGMSEIIFWRYIHGISPGVSDEWVFFRMKLILTLSLLRW